MNNTPGRTAAPDSTETTRRTFTDPDSAVEYARMLRALASAVPVPRVRFVDGADVVFDSPTGRSGATVLNRDTASSVLTACGRALAKVHDIDTSVAFAHPTPAGVLVHGDFGPGRLLFHQRDVTVAGVVGWEYAHIGAAVEDLAWCEWSIRNEHPDCLDAVPHLYYGYGIEMPPWHRRQSAMVAKCRTMVTLAAQRKDGTASRWHRHAAIAAAWRA